MTAGLSRLSPVINLTPPPELSGCPLYVDEGERKKVQNGDSVGQKLSAGWGQEPLVTCCLRSAAFERAA